jgi:hypothetical protein
MSVAEQLQGLYKTAKQRLDALNDNPEVIKVVEKLKGNPGAILSADEQRAADALENARKNVITYSATMEKERDEAASRKRPRDELPDFDCDFGAADGKGNKSLIGQRKTLVTLHDSITQIEEAVHEARLAVGVAVWEDAGKAVGEAIAASKATFREAAKDLVVAYEHGWEVVKKMRGTKYAETEEEQKALKAAIKAVGKKGGAGAKPKGPPGASAAGTSSAGGAGMAKPGPCYKCGVVGHFAVSCPNKRV